MSTSAISGSRIRELIAGGQARPLLAGHFPVPVELDQQWWHLPTDATVRDEGEEMFVPASAELAEQFTRFAARRAAGDAAQQRLDRGDDR